MNFKHGTVLLCFQCLVSLVMGQVDHTIPMNPTLESCNAKNESLLQIKVDRFDLMHRISETNQFPDLYYEVQSSSDGDEMLLIGTFTGNTTDLSFPHNGLLEVSQCISKNVCASFSMSIQTSDERTSDNNRVVYSEPVQFLLVIDNVVHRNDTAYLDTSLYLDPWTGETRMTQANASYPVGTHCSKEEYCPFGGQQVSLFELWIRPGNDTVSSIWYVSSSDGFSSRYYSNWDSYNLVAGTEYHFYRCIHHDVILGPMSLFFVLEEPEKYIQQGGGMYAVSYDGQEKGQGTRCEHSEANATFPCSGQIVVQLSTESGFPEPTTPGQYMIPGQSSNLCNPSNESLLEVFLERDVLTYHPEGYVDIYPDLQYRLETNIAGNGESTVLANGTFNGTRQTMAASGVWYKAHCIPKATNGEVPCGLFTISFPVDAYTTTVSIDGGYSYASQYSDQIQYVVAIDEVVYRNGSDYLYGKYPNSQSGLFDEGGDDETNINNHVDFFTGKCSEAMLCNGDDQLSLFELQMTPGKTSPGSRGWHIASNEEPYVYITSDWGNNGVVEDVEYYYYKCLDDTTTDYFLVLNGDEIGIGRRSDGGDLRVTYAGQDRGQGKQCGSDWRCVWPDIIVELYDTTEEKKSSGMIGGIVVGVLVVVSILLLLAIHSTRNKRKREQRPTTALPSPRHGQQPTEVAAEVPASSVVPVPSFTTDGGELIAVPVQAQIVPSCDPVVLVVPPIANEEATNQELRNDDDYC